MKHKQYIYAGSNLFSSFLDKTLFTQTFKNSFQDQSVQQINIHNKMVKKCIIKTKGKNSKFSLFLKDPKSDLFLLVKDMIIPLHTDVVAKYSPYFKNLIPCSQQKKQVHIINQPLNAKTVINVLKYHYGQQIQITNANKYIQIMEIVTYFDFSGLRDRIVEEIKKNISEFNIFWVLEFSKYFCIDSLEIMCWKHLQRQNFQQIKHSESSLEFSREQILVELLQRLLKNRIERRFHYLQTKTLIEQYKSLQLDKQRVKCKIDDIILKGGVEQSKELKKQQKDYQECSSNLFSSNESKQASTLASPTLTIEMSFRQMQEIFQQNFLGGQTSDASEQIFNQKNRDYAMILL